MDGYGKLRRSTDKAKTIVEFYRYLAAASSTGHGGRGFEGDLPPS